MMDRKIELKTNTLRAPHAGGTAGRDVLWFVVWLKKAGTLPNTPEKRGISCRVESDGRDVF